MIIPFTETWNTMEVEKRINADVRHVGFEVLEIHKWKIFSRQL